MEWGFVLERLIWVTINSAPWLIGMLGGLSILSFGPLGRAISQRLKYGIEDKQQSEGILEELVVIRRKLEELIERQYATERLLTGNRGEQLTPQYPTPTDSIESTEPQK